MAADDTKPKHVRKLVIVSSVYKTSGWLPSVTNSFKTLKSEFLTNAPLKTAYDAVAPDNTQWATFLESAFACTPFDMGNSNIAKITAPVLIISGNNDGMDRLELAKTCRLIGGGVSADLGPMPKSHLANLPSQSHVTMMIQTKLF